MRYKDKITEEIIKAYSDCNGIYESAKRKLDFKASGALSLNEAKEAMKQAIPNGYNEFTASKLRVLDAVIDTEVKCWVAREGSVCLYLENHGQKEADLPELIEILSADEVDILRDGQLRIWWD